MRITGVLFAAPLLLAALVVANDTTMPPVDVVPVNYTDSADDDYLLQGYLSVPDSVPASAVIILPDWNGVNTYEQQRATMIAKELGYVGFAADIYGIDLHNVENFTERIALATLYRSNSTLFVSRINAAYDTVAALDSVDSDNIAVIGYCFGGSGVIQYALSGQDRPAGLVSFHGGLTGLPEAGPVVGPKLLVLSGGEDDTSTEVEDLENTLNDANATWEITRYSGIEHAFTVFGNPQYNQWADQRSWESTRTFLQEAFGEIEYAPNPPDEVQVTAIDYSDGNVSLHGYLSVPDVTPAPVVVILPDWDGVNSYEQQRATLLADYGYVGFAADIYGNEYNQFNLTFEEKRTLATFYRSNSTLFVQRIQAAVDKVNELKEVKSEAIGIIGFCFGGSGVLYDAFLSQTEGVSALVSFHGGLRNLPTPNPQVKPYIMIQSGGIDDQHGNQSVLEESLNEGNASWEITRYANVDHAFTVWDGSQYNVLADARSFDAMMTMFDELLPLTTPNTSAGVTAVFAKLTFVTSLVVGGLLM